MNEPGIIILIGLQMEKKCEWGIENFNKYESKRCELELPLLSQNFL